MIELSGWFHQDQTIHLLLCVTQFWFWMKMAQDQRRMKRVAR